MNVLIKLLSIVLTFSLTIIVPAQQRKSGIRISKGKPTVYITFVRFAKREPQHTNESDEGVWLRVHNNTRWPLIFSGFGWFTKNDDEVTMFYGVEEVPKPRGAFIVDSSRDLQPSLPPWIDQPPSRPQSSEAPKVEKDNCDVPPGDWGIDVVAPVTLPPGKSVIFSVPRETLCKNLKIYIVYSYAWEKDSGDEPEHRVYFYGRDLPKAAR